MDKEERERMNEYTYEQIAEGHTESFQVTLTEEMMEQFLRITGDVIFMSSTCYSTTVSH